MNIHPPPPINALATALGLLIRLDLCVYVVCDLLRKSVDSWWTRERKPSAVEKFVVIQFKGIIERHNILYLEKFILYLCIIIK